MGQLGGPFNSSNSQRVEPEKTFNFYDDVGNLVLDHTRMDGDGGAVGERCQTLLCPRWVILLFVKDFQGRARPRVIDEALGTSNGGGSLQDDQHHGGVGELFSSEVISSLKEVGWKEAQCVRRLELKKGLSPCWKELGAGKSWWEPVLQGQLPVWAEQQGWHTVLDGVLGVSNILFSS